ncbi:hypothetical protein TSUD_83830 [Trifolium subterraneum]|uniref:BZIP domain-containing protein n=1 Tax=Trifolium subterraneum TaxID=3900 RepID=A0A2Z6M0F8_TRISU|nr:hypothetical protein TSUD_83830 [Trifolium subterraneum]
MDEILKCVYPAAIETAKQQQPTNENPTIDDVAGSGTTHHDHHHQHPHPSSGEGLFANSSGADEGTIEDFLVRAGVVPAPHQYPSSDASASHQVAMGKQKAVEETLEPDKAAIQKEEKRIKNREAVARCREREKARNTKTEDRVKSLKTKIKKLLEEQAEKEKQRHKMMHTEADQA